MSAKPDRGAPPLRNTNSDDERRKVVDWIDSIKARFKVEVPDIAKRAVPSLSPSTIYRWIDPDGEFTPSLSKLRQIAKGFDVPLPSIAGVDAPDGFHEGQLQHYDAKPGDDFGGVRVTADQSCWRVNSRELELAGYLPGDIVLADPRVKPQTGDVVVAQIVDMQSGEAETRLRFYQPPFLTTRSMDPRTNALPQFVDEEKVQIWGTVVRSVRIRRVA